VIEGGPGTGKTAVALHRVAYLLYTHRERHFERCEARQLSGHLPTAEGQRLTPLARSGVLAVGPSAGFIRYVGGADHVLTGEVRVVPGEYTEDEGATAGEKLLAESLPTAVITANDPCAVGILDTVLRAGLTVPGELSVVGYDDSRFGRLPGIDLTSVRQDIPKMARLAVKAVLDRLDRPGRKPRDQALRPKLVVRGTTAPPRGTKK
jgi:hypothetical protein